jgi:serine protease Do
MKKIKVAACLVVLAGATAAAALLAPARVSADRQAPAIKRAQAAVRIAGGARLGISIREVEEEDVKSGRLSSPAGAVVEEVSEDSPAASGGLRKGDIIVEFDGERVRSARQLTRLVQETADGRKSTTVVVRDGQRVTLTVEPRAGSGFGVDRLYDFADWGNNLALRVPPRAAVPVVPTPRAPTPPSSIWRMDDLLNRGGARLGITVDSLSPQLAAYFGTKEGVLVTSVQDNSTAAKIGVKAGDVITSVNGTSVDDPSELRRRLQSLTEGAEFTIGVVRDKRPQTLKGKIEPTGRRRTYRSIL